MAQYGKEYTQGLQEQTPLLMQEMTAIVPAAAVVAVPVEEKDRKGGTVVAAPLPDTYPSDSTRPKRNPQVEERLALQQAHINGRRYAEDEIRSLRAAERNSHITDWQIEEQLRRGNRQRSADFKPAYGLPERDEAPPSAPPLEQPKNPGYAISDYSSVYDGEGGYKMEEYKSIYD